MANLWAAEWAGLSWRVEHRAARETGGNTLRIGPAADAATSTGTGQTPGEWLRFDCFRSDPHWHLDPKGRNEIHRLDELGAAATEIFSLIRAELPHLLARAGASPEQCAFVRTELSSPRAAPFLLDAERAIRNRPAVLDELDLRILEHRRSEKWHTYPRDVLPAWVAEMDFPVAAPIQDELRRFTEQADVGYPIGLGDTGLADVFSERMRERFDWSPDPARVEILSEVVQGMYLALEAFAEPNQGAIVQTPIYPPFLSAVRETGRRLVENPLVPESDGSDSRLAVDFDGLASGIDAETRVFLFCNPHNPSGRCFGRSELERLADIAIEKDLIVVSDEIHGDLVYGERPYIPFASLAPEVAERTVTLSSPSKAFNIPGLRCAVAHFGSEKLQRRFNTVLPRHVRGGIGLMGIYASIAAWRWSQPWLDEVRPYLEANRDFVEWALAERIPEIEFFSPEATYLAWLDCSRLDLRTEPAAHFLSEGRVALSRGSNFGRGWEKFVRLNFATSRPILTEIIDRLAKALGR